MPWNIPLNCKLRLCVMHSSIFRSVASTYIVSHFHPSRCASLFDAALALFAHTFISLAVNKANCWSYACLIENKSVTTNANCISLHCEHCTVMALKDVHHLCGVRVRNGNEYWMHCVYELRALDMLAKLKTTRIHSILPRKLLHPALIPDCY